MRQICLAIAILFIVAPLLAIANSDADSQTAENKKSARNEPTGKKEASTEAKASDKAGVKKPATATAKTAGSKKVSKTTITKDQEAAAKAFVKNHHKALLKLLVHLKAELPSEYNRAIHDLSRTSDRLSQFQKRDSRRYELELALWKTESQRQLLHARLQMTHDEKLVKPIRETLEKEHELHLSILNHERDRLAARVEKLEAQIEKQSQNREASVKRKLNTLTRPSKKLERRVKNKTPKPATSKTTKKPT